MPVDQALLSPVLGALYDLHLNQFQLRQLQGQLILEMHFWI